MKSYWLCIVAIPTILAAQHPTPRPTPQNGAVRPIHQKAESADADPTQKQRGSDEAPFVVKVIEGNDTASKTQTNQNEGDSKQAEATWRLSDRLAAIASVVAFLQFLALVITIAVMIRNGRRQLRAYVLPESAGLADGTLLIPPQPAKANVPGVFLLVKNGGQTPAYNVASWAGIAVIPVQQESIALVIPPITQDYTNTLGSGSSFTKTLWFDRPLTPNEIADIAAGTRAIYVYGKIEYRDAFKKRRFTNFRVHYTMNQFPPAQFGALLNFAQTGNDAN